MQVGLLEDYIGQLEREIDRYKTSLKEAKELPKKNQTSNDHAVIQKLKDDFLMLSESFETMTKGAFRFSQSMITTISYIKLAKNAIGWQTKWMSCDKARNR